MTQPAKKTLRELEDKYQRLLNSKKTPSGEALRKAREAIIKRRFDMGF